MPGKRAMMVTPLSLYDLKTGGFAKRPRERRAFIIPPVAFHIA